MSSLYPMLKHTAIWGGGIIGLGVVLFKYTTPTDEELLARMSPELRAKVESQRELRQQEQKKLMEIVKRTASSDEPIWKTGELYNPWEKTGNKLLVDKINYERETAEVKAKSELDKAKETQTQLSSSR